MQENYSYHEELISLADSLGLKYATAKNMISALSLPANMDVLFLLSVPAQLKEMLLKTAKLLVYTPTNEHFGIVPLEAMLARLPVLAANTGGPLETIVEGQTGWLRDVGDVGAWTEVMGMVLQDMTEGELEAMGRAGHERVKAEFSQTKMADRLDEEIDEMIRLPRIKAVELQDVLLMVGIGGAVAVAVLVLAFRPG